MPEKTFPLDARLGAGAGLTLELTGTTDADVVMAVAQGSPLPTRPDGVLELGAIGLALTSGQDLAITAGATTMDLSFGASVAAGLGVYDTPDRALEALDLGEVPGLNIAVPDPADTRFILLRTGYAASGSVTGTHPMGAVGSFGFGLSATAAGTAAVLHGFAAAEPAGDVLARIVGAWQLPRQVDAAEALPPQTWVIAEAEGSIAVQLAAQVGYDFNFVREVGAGGLSGDIGLKIDAAAKATIGLEVSGRYLIVVGRPSDRPRLRVWMFKLARRGVQFGLNLKVGVTGIDSFSPDTVDDFVEAVFGVHGAQIVAALGALEKWTDKTQPVHTLVAGLINEKALELITVATGIDASSAFVKARDTLGHAISLWKQLPDTLSSELLAVLKGMGEHESKALLASVTLLSSDDDVKQKQALVALLETRGFEQTPVGRLLLALADRGLLDLLNRLPEVRRSAGLVADILDGDVIRKLQAAVGSALNLDALENATKTDFKSLDSFLVGRLEAFLERKIDFAAIEEIRAAIDVVIRKRQAIYDQARKALTTRYGGELATTWQKTTSRTALLDVEFDTSSAHGRELLTAVLRQANLDALLTSTSSAITVRAALLTHEVKRKSTLQVTLPKLSFRTEHANTSLASMQVEEETGRLLMYHLDAHDAVTNTRRRYRSSLSVSLTTAAAVGGGHDLRVRNSQAASWGYELRHARTAMHRGELEMYSRPFLETYMNDQFGGPQQWSKWYTELDRTVEGLLGNGPDQFGDALLSLQVTIPGDALKAWAQPSPHISQSSKDMSKAIQGALKALIPYYHFQRSGNLLPNASAAALLVWSAIPPTTFVPPSGTTGTIDDGDSIYWDWPIRAIRQAQTRRPRVAVALAQRFVSIRQRLLDLNLNEQAAFFDGESVEKWIRDANSGLGDQFLQHLCRFEALVVEKAASAFAHMQAFVKTNDASPSTAIDRLAEFGADITTAFNKLSGDTVFSSAPVRAITQGVFLDATRAIATISVVPSAMLTLTVLKPAAERKFQIDSFINGDLPQADDIAVEQRIVSLGD